MKIKNIIFQIESLTFQEALEYIVKNVAPKDGKDLKKVKKLFIATINTELVMLAKKDKYYEKVLRSADLAVCDGVGIVWAGKMFGKTFPQRIHGVDLVQKLSEFVAKKPITLGFLGGRENVAQLTADCLKSKYPGLDVAFAIEEWSSLEINKKEESRIKNQESRASSHNSELIIHNSRLKCDILFVAFGSPKQEKWIYENLDKIDAKVAIGVGGSFDFISGKIRRAPAWIRKIGLEWLFRLIIQPWRIKRQLVLPEFVLLTLKERFYR